MDTSEFCLSNQLWELNTQRIDKVDFQKDLLLLVA